jgi:amidase
MAIDLFQSATETARAIRRKDLSAREVTEALLDRIDSVNPQLNAIVELRREEALQLAEAADNALAQGKDVGPLHGVPMTIKDAIDVAGLHTTWGNPDFADYIAPTDSAVAARLKQAGAVIIGKSNVAEMLADFGQTANRLYGVSNNPWDLTRTPGGSSGGGAAAVSVGLSFLEYGSDLVGSIRIPAGLCGVYGLRPSAHAVPLAGFQPPGAPTGANEMTYLSTLGPLARTAEDLRTALMATAGPLAPRDRAYRWNLAPARHAELKEFRVGFVLDDDNAPVSSEVSKVLGELVEALVAAGVSVNQGWPAGVDPAAQAQCFSEHVQAFFAYQEGGEAEGYFAQERARMTARDTWQTYFRDFDVFLSPATLSAAYPHDSRPFHERMIPTPDGELPYVNQPFWTAHAALVGLPAVVAPVGLTAAGLPVGVQVVGPQYEDDTAITFAELLAPLTEGSRQPPL